MKRKILFALIILASISVIAYAGIFPVNKKNTFTKMSVDDYSSNWAKVDDAQQKGLTRTALEEVNHIYDQAIAEENYPQIIKALIHQFKFKTFVEENSQQTVIADLKTAIENAPEPSKSILHSIAAQSYLTYYQNNRWRFMNRTETVTYDPNDWETWSLDRISKEIQYHFGESLKNEKELQKFLLKDYEAILTYEENTANIWPTVYDLLASRALDFYWNDQFTLVDAADKFEVKGSDVFENSKTFSKISFANGSSSGKLLATKLHQQLEAFHLNDTDPLALSVITLKRLGKMHVHSVSPNKDELYLNALRSLKKQNANNESFAEISHAEAQFLVGQSYDRELESDESKKGNLKKAVAICEEAMQKYGKSYGGEQCSSLWTNLNQKAIDIQMENENISGKPFRAFINYKNIEKVHFRLVKWNAEIDEKYNNIDQYKAQLKYLTGLPIAKEWSVDLPVDDDLRNHSVEVPIESMPKGQYALLGSVDDNFNINGNAVSFQNFWVTDISYISNITAKGKNIYVLHRETGKPLANTEIKIYERFYNKRQYEYRLTETLTTDNTGYALAKSSKDYRNVRLEFSNGNDQFIHNDYISYYGTDAPQPYDQIQFFLDRKIYRPGQTIYFKGIYLRNDGKGKHSIQINKNVTVVFRDANYQEVSKLNLKSNDYGTFSGEFIAPSSLLGNMTIQTDNGSINFSVEEYKRPKFEVKFDTIDKSYAINDEVEITGFARSYAGVAINDAKVQYRVVRETKLPWCWWWGWRGYNPYQESTEITNGTATTDENGKYTIPFTALPNPSSDLSLKPEFRYTVYADVTDVTGETRSSQTVVVVGVVSLQLESSFPQDIITTNVNDIAITTSNLNGTFQAADVKVEIFKLNAPNRILTRRHWQKPDKFLMMESEYVKMFPNDIYKDEDQKINWEQGKKVLSKSFKTTKGYQLDMQDASNWQGGEYVAIITTNDGKGNDVKQLKHFTLINPKSKKTETQNVLLANKDAASYQPGENAVISVATGAEPLHVLYEVLYKDELIESKWITLKSNETLKIPIIEKYRGGISTRFAAIRHNQYYNDGVTLPVPWSNKELDIELSTFRNKLQPGAKEEWEITVKGPDKAGLESELLVGMYDASLNAFAKNNWDLNLYGKNYASAAWQSRSFNLANDRLFADDFNPRFQGKINRRYPNINMFGFNLFQYRYVNAIAISAESTKVGGRRRMGKAKSAPMPSAPTTGNVMFNLDDADMEESMEDGYGYKEGEANKPEAPQEEDLSAVQTRKNLQETAFFYPHLKTDKDGNLKFSFTSPEALTKWQFMAIGHTKDLKIGSITEEIVTQKELMVVPNSPRFLREGDKIYFTGKVSNLSDKALQGQASLMLFDALTMEPIDSKLGLATGNKNFNVSSGQSEGFDWQLTIPQDVQAVTYRMVAKAGNFSDGEENAVPVLSNRMLVTEALPLPVRGNQSKTFTLDKLKNNSSTTLSNHKLTLEFSSNPAWYAVQALPYMMEYPYDCSEQIFSRYYANAIAAHVANSNPKIKAVFEQWTRDGNRGDSDALLSNLEKNQELKSLLLEETPWVREAQDEGERKKRIALLFNVNKMANEKGDAENKLLQRQYPNGGWPWFAGGKESRYITQHIVAGFGHLDKLGIKHNNPKIDQMLAKANQYLDIAIKEDYQNLKKSKAKLSEKQIGYTQIHYLYARSFFSEQAITNGCKDAFDYYQGQSKKYWLSNNKYSQGMIALSLHRYKVAEVPMDIIKSLKENAVFSDELGMYFKDMQAGCYWHQAPIESQALIIEAFDEVANDAESVDEMRVWLLKQKQVQDWKTTKATAEAVYALLLRGGEWLNDSKLPTITLGSLKVDPLANDDTKVEAGTGYFKMNWNKTEVKPEMATVSVKNNNDVVAWGGLYWQYFEDLDKITPAETPLKLNKKLFKEVNSSTGKKLTPIDDNAVLEPGDVIKVRIELRVDRDMEFIHMKDMRASGFEPVNVFSTYKWQDGLGYYESTRDAATNFFIDWLPKGTYVFEYPLRAVHKGDFSNGITTIQSMYAPEFTSHSEGVRVEVR